MVVSAESCDISCFHFSLHVVNVERNSYKLKTTSQERSNFFILQSAFACISVIVLASIALAAWNELCVEGKVTQPEFAWVAKPGVFPLSSLFFVNERWLLKERMPSFIWGGISLLTRVSIHKVLLCVSNGTDRKSVV